MIQIYNPDNTKYDKNGDMPIFPTKSVIHVIINGVWTAEMRHPIDKEGRWKYIIEEAVVKMPSFNGEQLFRIKHKEKTDSGITADLQPIFMDAKDDCFLVDVRPTEKNGQQALDIMTAPNKKYSAKSDIVTISTAYYENKNLIEAINGEDDNSFVNRWGGEILFDNYEIIVNERVGGDYGAEVLYGKNIQEDGFIEEVDTRDVVTRLVPKAYNGYMMEGDENYVDSPLIDKYPTIRYGVMTFEDVKMREDAQEDDEEKGVTICDTQEELRTALTKKCEEQFGNGLDKPKVSIEVDMVALEKTEQYKDVKDLVKASLGDTVHCRHNKLDITTDARVIELEWDCIQEKVASIVLGDYQYNYIDQTSSMINRIEAAIRKDGSVRGQQVQGIINGVQAQLRAMSSVAKKSNVRAVLFEDLDPESPTFGAMCLGTMGFQIASGRTADGRDWDWSTFGTGQGFYADFIVAGTMLADRIKGGTLELGGTDNGNGVARVLDENGKEIVRLDKDGVFADGTYTCASDEYGRQIQIGNGAYKILNSKGEEIGIIKCVSNSIMVLERGSSSIRMFDDAIYFDAKTIGPGTPGKTGRLEFSDGTYLDIKKGWITGGKTKEGTF